MRALKLKKQTKTAYKASSMHQYFMKGKKHKTDEELKEYDEGESGSEFVSPLNELK